MNEKRGMMTRFLASWRSVIYIVCDESWQIRDCNTSFKDLLDAPFVEGSCLLDYLTPQSRDQLKSAVSDGLELKLVFMGHRLSNVPVGCMVFFDGSTRVIAGERPQLSNSEVLGRMTEMQNDLVNVTRELQKKNRELERANAAIRTLRGIIPICSFCKGIRNDKGYWKRLEEYMEEMTEAEFSHSICPDCVKEHYPDLED